MKKCSYDLAFRKDGIVGKIIFCIPNLIGYNHFDSDWVTNDIIIL